MSLLQRTRFMNSPSRGAVMGSMRRIARALLPVLLAAASAAPPAAAGRKPQPKAAAPPPGSSLEQAARGFEAAQWVTGAERLAALASLDQSLVKIADEGGSAERAAALALAGAVRCARADFARAEDAYRKSQRGAEHGPFADDADFAAIRCLEAQGR